VHLVQPLDVLGIHDVAPFWLALSLPDVVPQGGLPCSADIVLVFDRLRVEYMALHLQSSMWAPYHRNTHAHPGTEHTHADADSSSTQATKRPCPNQWSATPQIAAPSEHRPLASLNQIADWTRAFTECWLRRKAQPRKKLRQER
jgi:hypothetical protein